MFLQRRNADVPRGGKQCPRTRTYIIVYEKPDDRIGFFVNRKINNVAFIISNYIILYASLMMRLGWFILY